MPEAKPRAGEGLSSTDTLTRLALSAARHPLPQCGRGIVKANFDPDEPRIPKGEPGAGQWTDSDGDPGEDEAAERRPAGVSGPDAFFDAVYEKVHALADRLDVNENWLLGLAAHESGYLDDHNRELNNPFGLTHGGGRNVAYNSIDAAIAYWERRFGPAVQGATSAEDFVQRLFAERYNTNPAWPRLVLRVINSVPRRLSAWKGKRNL